jgi:hypothetical protein
VPPGCPLCGHAPGLWALPLGLCRDCAHFVLVAAPTSPLAEKVRAAAFDQAKELT